MRHAARAHSVVEARSNVVMVMVVAHGGRTFASSRLMPSRSSLSAGKAAAKPEVMKASAAKKAALHGASGNTIRKVRTSVTFHRPKTLRLPRAPKYQRKSVHHLPRMDAHTTILFPLNTESAMKKIEEENTLVMICDRRSNKRQVS